MLEAQAPPSDGALLARIAEGDMPSFQAFYGEIDERRLAESEGPGDLCISVRQALSRVEPEQRRAIEMAYFGGLTYEETARRLELPLGTLKSRIRSGLKTLRSLLEHRMEAR
ncbi:MAG TPA: sigma factor-like helix-turn-helix DNA-binding protein [Thermoanaerobaculia bacterium]